MSYSNYKTYNQFKGFNEKLRGVFVCRSGDSMTGNLNMTCNDVLNVKNLSFCPGGKVIGDIELSGNITIGNLNVENLDVSGVLTVTDISNEDGLLYLNGDLILTEKSIIIDTVKFNVDPQLQIFNGTSQIISDINYFDVLSQEVGRDSDLLAISKTSPISLSNNNDRIFVDVSGNNKWGGAILARSSTETIFMIPADYDKIILFTPLLNIKPYFYTVSNQPEIQDKWRGALYYNNNESSVKRTNTTINVAKVIGVPYNHNHVISVNNTYDYPSNTAINLIIKYHLVPDTIINKFSSGGINDEGWVSGCGSPRQNNIFYMAPGKAKDVLRYNAVNDNISGISLPLNIVDLPGIKYSTSIVSLNKNIYMFPRDISDVLIVDTLTETLSTVNLVIPPNEDSSTTDLFYGGVLATNKKMYITPFKNRHILEFDPTDNSYNFIQLPLSPLVDFNSGKKNWMNAVLSQNGKVYAMPHEANVVLEFDPITHESRYLPIPSKLTTQNKYCGGILTSSRPKIKSQVQLTPPSEFLYGIPCDEDRILEMRFTENMPNSDWMVNYYFNKV